MSYLQDYIAIYNLSHLGQPLLLLLVVLLQQDQATSECRNFALSVASLLLHLLQLDGLVEQVLGAHVELALHGLHLLLHVPQLLLVLLRLSLVLGFDLLKVSNPRLKVEFQNQR